MTPSQKIDAHLATYDDWRGQRLAQLRQLINEAAPQLTEDWKWETAVWKVKKLVCALGVFKDHVKLNFFNGALIADPQGLFNNGLEAKRSRSIDFKVNDLPDTASLAAIIRAAAEIDG